MLDLGEIESLLMRRVRNRKWGGATAIAAGVPFSFALPCLMTMAFSFVNDRILGYQLPWMQFFVVASGVLIPIVFYTEWRSRGRFYEDAIADRATPLYGIGTVRSSYGEVMLDRWRSASIGITEICLFGPRLVFLGVDMLHKSRTADDPIVLLAVAIVARLFREPHAVSTSALSGDKGSPDDLATALHWLASYGWIGIIDGGRRVLLYDESRDILNASDAVHV